MNKVKANLRQGKEGKKKDLPLRYKPYPKYKDSGIEWIGEIPEHWEVKKIKYLLKLKKGALKTGPFGSQIKNADLSPKGFKIYTQRSVLDNDFDSGDAFIPETKFIELRDFEIFPGDLLITIKRHDWKMRNISA